MGGFAVESILLSLVSALRTTKISVSDLLLARGMHEGIWFTVSVPVVSVGLSKLCMGHTRDKLSMTISPRLTTFGVVKQGL